MTDYEEIFNLSYWRVVQNKVGGVDFVDGCIANLLESSEEVRKKLENADVEAFRSALTLAIVHLASHYVEGKPNSILQGIARRQSREGRDVRPPLYDSFLKALLRTIKQYDPEHSPQVEEAWKTVLTPGLEYMKRMY